MVEEEEAKVSKEFHDKVVAKLEAKILKMEEANRKLEESHGKAISALREKLRVKMEAEKQKVVCPTCGRRVRYDGIGEEYVCPQDGWHGQTGILVE